MRDPVLTFLFCITICAHTFSVNESCEHCLLLAIDSPFLFPYRYSGIIEGMDDFQRMEKYCVSLCWYFTPLVTFAGERRNDHVLHY
jgi:hypothetical protein